MAVTVTWRGATVRGEGGQFTDFLGKKWTEIGDALVQGVAMYGGAEAKACAEDLMEDAKALAPVDKGNLQESARVEEKTNRKGITRYEINFDTRRTEGRSRGNNFNYAYIQHEDLSYKHKIGQAKFLETPYYQRRNEFLKRIADASSEGMGRAKK